MRMVTPRHNEYGKKKCNLIKLHIDKCCEKNPVDAIISSVKKLRGTYALAIMFDDEPDAIYAVRNVSPIVICKNDSGCYIASDIIAIAEYSTDYFVLPERSKNHKG